MAEVVNLITGLIVLILGIPIGNYLASQTEEELKPGQRWFKLITSLSLLGMLSGLILGNDVLLFSFAFIPDAVEHQRKVGAALQHVCELATEVGARILVDRNMRDLVEPDARIV